MPARSPHAVTLLLPVTLAILLLSGLAGLAAPAADPIDLETAKSDLARLQTSLKSRKSVSEVIAGDLDAVRDAYHNLAAPPPPVLEEIPADASDEDKAALEKENKKRKEEHEKEMGKFERDKEKFKKDAEKLFIKALKLQKIHASTNRNIRDDVNVKAAQIIGDTGTQKLAKAVQKAIDTTFFKAKYDVPTQLREEAFAALGKLNDMDSLAWMLDEFVHTKETEAEWMSAAHKAMVLFTDVPGKLRHAIVQDMVKTYAGLETQAKQNSPDVKIQAAKRLWDQIKNDVIKVVQYFAGAPLNDEGEALATMEEFARWFRAHKKPNRAPWKDEKKQK